MILSSGYLIASVACGRLIVYRTDVGPSLPAIISSARMISVTGSCAFATPTEYPPRLNAEQT